MFNDSNKDSTRQLFVEFSKKLLHKCIAMLQNQTQSIASTGVLHGAICRYILYILHAHVKTGLLK